MTGVVDWSVLIWVVGVLLAAIIGTLALVRWLYDIVQGIKSDVQRVKDIASEELDSARTEIMDSRHKLRNEFQAHLSTVQGRLLEKAEKADLKELQARFDRWFNGNS